MDNIETGGSKPPIPTANTGQKGPGMRRKDREVTDFPAILEIIEHCDILRLGLADGAYPYIVPVNFAYEVRDGQLSFYIHGAMAGRKYEMLRRNPVCSFEMDNPLYIECLPEKKDVTMRYECVMGRADVTFLEGEERQRAIDDVLMARYEMTKDFAYNQAVVSHTALMKLTVTELTAKANRA
ncbi:pyridoxamine 5'-phosphate oxidase family protein [Eubacterium pyruvativorans]|nr:pyridoxamine 5'-phosphate oxidase family protein [Eubacterium pyruvativorans]